LRSQEEIVTGFNFEAAGRVGPDGYGHQVVWCQVVVNDGSERWSRKYGQQGGGKAKYSVAHDYPSRINLPLSVVAVGRAIISSTWCSGIVSLAAKGSDSK
jgi:hypothetical protein